MSQSIIISSKSLTSLPSELVLEVVDLSYPHGFESMALTCKQLYNILFPMIHRYNFCSSWKPNPGDLGSHTTRNTPKDIFDPFYFLNKLSMVPRKLQHQLLRHITTIRPPNSFENRFISPTKCEQALKMVSNLEWLGKPFQKIHERDPGLKISNISTPPVEQEESEADSEVYLILLALILPRLQTLVMCGGIHLHGQVHSHLLSTIIKQDLNRTYLQHLKVLRLHSEGWASLKDLLPFLHLPKLGTIVVDGVRASCDEPPSSWNPCVVVPENQVEKSNLERLIFCTADVWRKDLEKVLKPLQNLRTFIWEDCTFRREQADCDELNHNTVSNLVHDTQTGYSDRIAILEQGELDVFSTGPSSNCVGRISHTSLWNPAGLLDLLAIHHKDKIQHLGLVISDVVRNIDVQRSQQILHFKQFSQLTHLSFDIRILRPRRIDHLPPSIISVTPPTLQVLRIELNTWPNGFHLSRLFGQVMTQRHAVPVLRKIIVRYWARGTNDQVADPTVEIPELKRQLGDIGITLDIGSVQTLQNVERCWEKRPSETRSGRRRHDCHLCFFWE